MNQLEMRIRRLEKAFRPEQDGSYLHELIFLAEFGKTWPDGKGAPPFGLAAYNEISERLERSR